MNAWCALFSPPFLQWFFIGAFYVAPYIARRLDLSLHMLHHAFAYCIPLPRLARSVHSSHCFHSTSFLRKMCQLVRQSTFVKDVMVVLRQPKRQKEWRSTKARHGKTVQTRWSCTLLSVSRLPSDLLKGIWKLLGERVAIPHASRSWSRSITVIAAKKHCALVVERVS